MKIQQVRVSKILERSFGVPFRQKWDLRKYNNLNDPAIFFGLYSAEDMKAFKRHRGYSIVIWGGAEQSYKKFKDVLIKKSFLGSPAYRPELIQAFNKCNFPYKKMILPLKDFSIFKPVELGNKIYVYKGLNGTRNEYFKWNEVILPIIRHFGEDRVVYCNNKPMEYVHDLYKQCFIYVKPNKKGGSTTMWEMGHMGIKTISHGQGDLPNVISFKNISNLIKIIKKEELKIGTIQYDTSEKTKNSMHGSDSWLYVNFWKK